MPKFVFILMLNLISATNLLGISVLNGDSLMSVRVAFYNFENLFDVYDDTATLDDDFTPSGLKGWSKKKFDNKCKNLYKTILAIGDDDPVAVLCVCEVENKYCLRYLLNNTPLKKLNYKFIHYDSPDARGIDVAIIYRPDAFIPIIHYPIKVDIPDSKTTRDVLYAQGIIPSGDTLHVFACHFPSRLGGQSASAYKRIFVANLIRNFLDVIVEENPFANVIVLGDMNDDPSDDCMKILDDSVFFNLSKNLLKDERIGTLKHGAFWNVFDQIVVSRNLLQSDEIFVKEKRAFVRKLPFLFVEDEKYGGVKLFRTFSGPKYLGGYSDHLPVYVDVICRK